MNIISLLTRMKAFTLTMVIIVELFQKKFNIELLIYTFPGRICKGLTTIAILTHSCLLFLHSKSLVNRGTPKVAQWVIIYYTCRDWNCIEHYRKINIFVFMSTFCIIWERGVKLSTYHCIFFNLAFHSISVSLNVLSSYSLWYIVKNLYLLG